MGRSASSDAISSAQSLARRVPMVSPLQRVEPPNSGSCSATMTRLPAFGRGLGRHQPRRTSADDKHVAIGVHALITRRVGRVAGPTETCGAADEPLAETSRSAFALERADHRAHEGLVVEAGRQALGWQGRRRRRDRRRARESGSGFRRPARRRSRRWWPGMLGSRTPSRNRVTSAFRLFHACREDAAGPMILEGAADDLDPAGHQRGGQRVAGGGRQSAGRRR